MVVVLLLVAAIATNKLVKLSAKWCVSMKDQQS
jgi:hypothetical protein